MSKNHLLSIVVPAYNEATRILAGELSRLIDSLQRQQHCWELIVVDDGSSDTTQDLVKQLAHQNNQVRLIKKPHRGKGFALLAGMLAAKGDYILFTDFDQATPIQECDQLLPWFDHGYDIVVGTRGFRRKLAPVSRKCISYGYMLLRTVITGFSSPVDSQCGFKAFTRTALQDIIKHLHVYNYDNRLPDPAIEKWTLC
jgi:dolichyl-phosphate beta-glucosyltransferase